MALRQPRGLLPVAAILLLAGTLRHAGGQRTGGAGDGLADSFVRTLDKGSFSQYVPSRAAGVLVNFYMPWCKYSKQLTLDYELLGHTFHRVRNVEIAKVNCENDKPLCEKHGVKGYPTLKWFPPGTVQGEGYTGGRASQDMIRFVNSRSGVQARPKHRPAKIRAVTPQELAAAVADEALDALVQFHVPGDEVCAHFAGEYDTLGTAMSAEDHVVLLTADVAAYPELAAEHGVRAVPLVKLFRRGGQGAVTYTSKYTAAALLPWLNGYADTARLLTGVTNSTVGRLGALDALADRLVKAPPNAWPSIAHSIQEIAAQFKGKAREYGDYYIEAVGDLTSPGGLDIIAAKRHELNARIVAEKAPELRASMLAQRNVMASMQARAEKAKMDPRPAEDPSWQQVKHPADTAASPAKDADAADGAERRSSPRQHAPKRKEPSTAKPPKKRRRNKGTNSPSSTAEAKDEL